MGTELSGAEVALEDWKTCSREVEFGKMRAFEGRLVGSLNFGCMIVAVGFPGIQMFRSVSVRFALVGDGIDFELEIVH